MRDVVDGEFEWAPVLIELGDDLEGEPLGTKEKFWVEIPPDDSRWLFKYARVNDGRVLGEDWAEWIVHGVGMLLGVPTAEILAAACDGRRGIVSKSVVPLSGRLVHGNSLLEERISGYAAEARRENPKYTVATVFEALRHVSAPSAYPKLSGMTAFEVWTGYLLLDALVAGRDRHHENWGIVSEAGHRQIAPSFDHGNALGFQELDDKRQRCLENPVQMLKWAERGRSPHFAGKPSLVDLAVEALNECSRDARNHWHEALLNLSLVRIRATIDSIPVEVMSDVTRSFVNELLAVNRRRLLDDYPVD